jgi:hypothetical protein
MKRRHPRSTDRQQLGLAFGIPLLNDAFVPVLAAQQSPRADAN